MNTNTITLTIPSTVAKRAQADDLFLAAVVACVCRCFGTWFGGFTRTNGIGGFVPDDGSETIEEAVVLVSASADNDRCAANLARAVALAKDVCVKMDQYCVALTVNGTMYFIDANTDPDSIKTAAMEWADAIA